MILSLQRSEPEPERHLEASRPGALVQFDCFRVGRLSGSKGTVWQYTAIHVASAYTWAELALSSLALGHQGRRLFAEQVCGAGQSETPAAASDGRLLLHRGSQDCIDQRSD